MKNPTEIALNHNRGFKWFQAENVNFKGYLFIKDRMYLTGQEAILYLSKVETAGDLKKLLAETDGHFAIVIQASDSVLIACDRVRTFPLFYNGNLVSDDPVNQEEEFDINKDAEHEFLNAAFVTDKDTLLKNLFQVQAGEVVEISENISSSFYYTYITQNWIDLTYGEAFNKLSTILDFAFSDFVSSLKSRSVAVSLSGGYDSRLIAMMLKKHNYTHVLCYTFGRKNNKELKNSRLSAERLGYPWVFIEYNHDTINGYLNSHEFISYYKYASKYTSMPFMQDYFAIRYLKENELVSDDTIFLAGHAGDVIAGSRLKGRFTDKTSTDEILNFILNDNYHLGDANFSQILIEKLKTRINFEAGKPASIYENWDQKERQSKYTVNSTSAYDYFGHEFRMPYWDLRLMDFFKHLSPEFKNYKRLYDDVLRESFFSQYDLNFDAELQTKKIEFQKQNVKDKIKKHIPFWLKKKLKKQHSPWHAHDIITSPMKEEIKDTDLGKNLGLKYASVISTWYVHELRRRKSGSQSPLR